jgi:hypothetical protein
VMHHNCHRPVASLKPGVWTEFLYGHTVRVKKRETKRANTNRSKLHKGVARLREKHKKHKQRERAKE